jgi:gluconokinase
MKLLLFGKIGSGKSYVGELFQREFGIAYHDADRDLPEVMREAIRNHEAITEEMRDDFVKSIIERIHLLSREHQQFCVAQALFKNRHRLRILERFPDLQMIWVRSSEVLTNARLEERTGHVASLYYAQMVNPNFEAPTHRHRVIENTVEDSWLRHQMLSILAQNTLRNRLELQQSSRDAPRVQGAAT